MFDTDGLFVFDTNILLDFFRLPTPIVNKLFVVFDKYQERIRIPFHVTEEYHKHALDLIQKTIIGLQEEINLINTEWTIPECIKIVDPSIYQATLQILNTNNEVIQKLLSSLLTSFEETNSIKNPIYTKMSTIFDNCALGSINDRYQQYLEYVAKERYKKFIPPGYCDSKRKDENKEGDYIIWWEILELVKKEGKSIILVSDDWKEDWLWKVHGKVVGPRPELRAEIYDQNANSELCINSLYAFLSHINKNIEEQYKFSNEELELIKVRKKLYEDWEKLMPKSQPVEDPSNDKETKQKVTDIVSVSTGENVKDKE